MKKFAELEFVQNLTWKKIGAIIAGFLSFMAIYTSVIWTVGTRSADSRADYVNMRYNELTTLEEKLKALEEENQAFRAQLGKETSETVSNMGLGKELKAGATDIDTKTNLIVSVRDVYDDRAYVALTFPDGSDYSANMYIGQSRSFETKSKKYQVIFTEITPKKSIKYMIREIATE